MKHILYIVGWMGSKKCYLDIPKEVAIERYKKVDDQFDPLRVPVECIEFDDEFSVYDIWE